MLHLWIPASAMAVIDDLSDEVIGGLCRDGRHPTVRLTAGVRPMTGNAGIVEYRLAVHQRRPGLDGGIELLLDDIAGHASQGHADKYQRQQRSGGDGPSAVRWAGNDALSVAIVHRKPPGVLVHRDRSARSLR